MKPTQPIEVSANRRQAALIEALASPKRHRALEHTPGECLDLCIKTGTPFFLWRTENGAIRLGIGAGRRLSFSSWQKAHDFHVESGEKSPITFFGGRFDPESDVRSDLWEAWKPVETYCPDLMLRWRENEENAEVVTRHGRGYSFREAKHQEPLENEHASDAEDWTHGETLVEWNQRVNRLLDAVRDGVLTKVVMVRAVHRPSVLTPERRQTIIKNLMAQGTKESVFAIGKGHSIFIGRSPETLIRRQHGRVSTHALAGTHLAKGAEPPLIGDAKTHREHAAVVRHLKEKLTPLCEELSIGPARVRPVGHLVHLETPISAPVSDHHLLELIAHVHPTPALCGEPTQGALDWLRRNEPLDRGWFGGPVGWFDDAGDGESAVAIRSALLGEKIEVAYAGAGVVDGSVPEDEWRETEAKLKTMLEALSS